MLPVPSRLRVCSSLFPATLSGGAFALRSWCCSVTMLTLLLFAGSLWSACPASSLWGYLMRFSTFVPVRPPSPPTCVRFSAHSVPWLLPGALLMSMSASTTQSAISARMSLVPLARLRPLMCVLSWPQSLPAHSILCLAISLRVSIQQSLLAVTVFTAPPARPLVPSSLHAMVIASGITCTMAGSFRCLPPLPRAVLRIISRLRSTSRRSVKSSTRWRRLECFPPRVILLRTVLSLCKLLSVLASAAALSRMVIPRRFVFAWISLGTLTRIPRSGASATLQYRSSLSFSLPGASWRR